MNIFAPLQWLGRTAANGVQAAGRGIEKGVSAGVRQVKQLPQRMGMESGESMMRTPDFNPNAAAVEPIRRTAGAGNLSEAAGIPLESRVGNYAGAMGVPDTGGGVLIENARPAASIDKARDFRPAVDPAIAGMDFGVSPNRQATPSGSASEKLFRRDVNAPFDPQPDPMEAQRRNAIVERYDDAVAPGGRLKLGLQNAGIGALRGIAAAYQANPRADWRELLAGGAGGGAVAGIGSAINPALGAEFQVENTLVPRMQRDEQRRQATEDRKYGEYRRQAEKAKTLSDIQYNQARAEAEARRNIYHNTPNETIDVRTGRTVPGTAKSPAVTPHYEMLKGPDGNPYYRNVADPANQEMPAYIRPTTQSDTIARRDLEDDMAAEEGTIEQIANTSLEGRKLMLYQRLPAPTRMILEKGQVVEEDYTRAATPAEVQRAYDEWQDVQAKELTRIKAETKAEREKKVGVRAKARRPANTSTAPRTLDDVMQYLR